jgi:Raf kinase inhibitor-like YbhB/YbcL family protein
MRQAFALLGLMTAIVTIGALVAFSKKADAPGEIVISPNNSSMLTLSSPAFANGGLIPPKHTCDGENINPELQITNVPGGAGSLVLVMDDPDIPDNVKKNLGIERFDHWVVYNIPVITEVIKEGEKIGQGGLNSTGILGYAGSCPPDREHRYFFRLYAIEGRLEFRKPPTLKEVEDAAKAQMIERTELMGRYERIHK